MAPVKPSALEPLLIKDSDDWCTIFKKLLKTAYFFYLDHRYRVSDVDGSVKTGAGSFGEDICNLDCET